MPSSVSRHSNVIPILKITKKKMVIISVLNVLRLKEVLLSGNLVHQVSMIMSKSNIVKCKKKFFPTIVA